MPSRDKLERVDAIMDHLVRIDIQYEVLSQPALPLHIKSTFGWSTQLAIKHHTAARPLHTKP
jgi:hypothetical protein